MGVTAGGDQPTIVGFCGLAVDGAAGVRAPVFAHTEGWYFIGGKRSPPRLLTLRDVAA
jgi:hypothetical protein